MNGRLDGRAGVRAAVLAALGVLLLPAPGEAHLATTGLGPLYDGITHVFLTPQDLVPILAMAFLAGQNGAAAGRRTLFALSGAWLAAGSVGYVAGVSPVPGAAVVASFLVLGGLIALDRDLPDAVVLDLAVSVGVLHGWMNGADIAAVQGDGTALIGIGGAVFVLVSLASALVLSLRAEWTRIAVRVVGSWVAAVGLLLLGWSLRGP